MSIKNMGMCLVDTIGKNFSVCYYKEMGFYMKIRAKNGGFTFVEAIITMSILSVVALAMSSMFIQQARQQRSAQVKMNQQQLVMVVQRAAGNPAALWASANKMVPATVFDDVTPLGDVGGLDGGVGVPEGTGDGEVGTGGL